MNIKNWLIEQIAEESGQDKSEVSLDEAFDNMNLDSLSLLSVSYELESKIGKEIDPSVFSEFNTINKLLVWLEKQE